MSLGWRAMSAVTAGRVAAAATRRMGRGGGTALPGLLAGRLAPGLLGELAAGLGHGAITVTGTNGKTTTAHLLAGMARAAGLQPLSNRSGSNMERGLLSAFLAEAASDGRPRDATRRLAVLEVDEAALPALFPSLRPRAAIFLNLFRDQLDRYGEVDSIGRAWARMLLQDASGVTLVLNADDPSIAELARHGRGDVITFGVRDRGVAVPALGHAADARFSADGHRYRYDSVYLGHLGEWRCDEEGRRRPPLDVAAERVRLTAEGSEFDLVVRGERFPVCLPLSGLYSVYNALAAVAGGLAVGIAPAVAAAALAEARPAFGRQERFTLRGREVRILLAKNPTGLSEVLRALRSADPPLYVLAMLNDDIQDGRDVSWIYDADVEMLVGRVAMLVASGARAEDCALRWHLGGIDPVSVQPHTATALDEALRRTPRGGRLDIVATYTAMLEVREAVASGAGVAPYWAEETPA